MVKSISRERRVEAQPVKLVSQKNGLYCKPECIEQRLEHVVEENNEIDRQDFRIRQFSGGLNAEILTLASF